MTIGFNINIARVKIVNIKMTVGFIIPFFLGMSYMKSENMTLLRFAALAALVGLFFVKDVWLKIPQMLPLS